MTTYTTINDTEIDAESIIDENLMALMRDNPIAMIEGEPGSPGETLKPLILITETTISNDATIDFTGLDSTYELYVFRLVNVRPSTDDQQLLMRFGTGGGPSWATSGYEAHVESIVCSTGVETSEQDTAYFGLHAAADGIGNQATENYHGEVMVFNPASATDHKKSIYRGSFGSLTTVPHITAGGGAYKSTTAVTGVRFFMSSGNLNTGSIIMYGLRK